MDNDMWFMIDRLNIMT